MLRHFKVPNGYSWQPEREITGGEWTRADSAHAGDFSAVAYFFARRLRASTGVPIAILNASWSGSAIEPWIPRAALGLSEDAVKNYIKSSKPTYPQFEAWVKSQPGVKLDRAAIDAHNAAITGYIHDDATRKGILEANGIPDDGSVHPGAVSLNNLDDWYEFHQAVLK